MNSLLIRTEVTPETGAGHFMRCLALAQAWLERGSKVIFILSCNSSVPFPEKIPPAIDIITLSARTGSHEDAEQTVILAEKYRSSWIILDGYNFDGAFQKIIRDSGNKLLVIDDYAHSNFYYADLILNQNIYARPELYKCRHAGADLLLGSPYILLRQEFAKWRTWQRNIPEQAKKILVTMGGSDQRNATLTVLHALQCINDPDMEVRIVTGFHNPFIKQLQEECRNCRFSVRFIESASDMAELIAWADLGISAAGSTSWELAFLGLPSLLVSLSQNQVPVAQILNEKQVSRNLGVFETVSVNCLQKNLLEMMNSRELREQFSNNGRLLVDGFGPDRVIMKMSNNRIRLRRITPEDCEMLWNWANDSEVRRNAFEQRQIDINTHAQWFNRKLESSDSFLFIAVDENNTPVGQIRFDCSGDIGEVDISVDKNRRHEGLGAEILKEGLNKIFQKTRIKKISAHVKNENMASKKMFEQGGFTFSGKEIIKGVEVYTLTYLR